MYFDKVKVFCLGKALLKHGLRRGAVYHSKMEFLALLLVLASSQWLVCAETTSECPALWSHLKSNHCEYGMDLEGGIICSGHEVHLRVDYTMTVDPRKNEIVAALNDYGLL